MGSLVKKLLSIIRTLLSPAVSGRFPIDQTLTFIQFTLSFTLEVFTFVLLFITPPFISVKQNKRRHFLYCQHLLVYSTNVICPLTQELGSQWAFFLQSPRIFIILCQNVWKFSSKTLTSVHHKIFSVIFTVY